MPAGRISLLMLCVFTWATALADVSLPALFGNSMVLQRDKPIRIWGTATPGEKITITFKSQKVQLKAEKTGQWKTELAAEPAGGPFTLTVQGRNTIALEDVLIGEVWLLSGQSNMEWTVARSMNAQQEIANANDPLIRHYKVQNTVATSPQSQVPGSGWKPALPEHTGSFSAVGYYFARQLRKTLNVPVGLLNSSWGGTHVETWTSREALATSTDFAYLAAQQSQAMMDSAQAARRGRYAALQQQLNEHLDEPNMERRAQPAYNDAPWGTLQVPGFWERQALPGLDGVVWLRYSFGLSAAQAGAATLHLGKIDDNETTFVNGKQVGATQGYNKDRQYSLPAGLLQAGTNTLAIRIDDTGGEGGLYSDAADIYLQLADGSRKPLAGAWKYRVEKVHTSTGGGAMGPNDFATLLYNGMIHPLIPFTFRGALWYQGESNTGRAFSYRKAFPLMIHDWRSRWGMGDFPFYFVQLATYFAGAGGNKNAGDEWAELREAQTLSLQVPNTGMAVTTDIGDPKDIHPTNKQEVGRRLALIALRDTYGQPETLASGPVLTNVVPRNNALMLSFSNIGSGLMANDKYGYLYGFEVAGADRKYHWARAAIEGNQVRVTSDAVPNPVAVRYNWTDNAEAGNLFNKEGLPAGPFRTDEWPRTTEGRWWGKN